MDKETNKLIIDFLKLQKAHSQLNAAYQILKMGGNGSSEFLLVTEIVYNEMNQTGRKLAKLSDYIETEKGITLPSVF